MKQNEIFADLRTLSPCIIRADGKGFSKLTKREKFEKPYDVPFQSIMYEAVNKFMTDSGYNARFAYTFSDEISICFDGDLPFEGRIEKLTSTIAGYLSSAFTLSYLQRRDVPEPITFDARVVPLQGEAALQRYMAWRQAECWRNFVQGWGFWSLVKEGGMSQTAAQKVMDSKKISDVMEMCFQEFGLNLAEKPCYQRRGTMMYFETYTKNGYNPKTKKDVLCERRRLRLDNSDVPEFRKPEGAAYLKMVMEPVA